MENTWMPLLLQVCSMLSSQISPPVVKEITYLETRPEGHYQFFNVAMDTSLIFNGKASDSVYICLSDRYEEHNVKESMFEIILGSQHNTKSLIKRNNTILAEVDTPHILSDYKYIDFFVDFVSIDTKDKAEIEISIRSNNNISKPFLTYRGPRQFNSVQFAGLRSDSFGQWQLTNVQTYPKEKYQFFPTVGQKLTFQLKNDRNFANLILAESPDNLRNNIKIHFIQISPPYFLTLLTQKFDKTTIVEKTQFYSKTGYDDIQIEWDYIFNEKNIPLMTINIGVRKPLISRNYTDLFPINCFGIRTKDSVGLWRIDVPNIHLNYK